MEGRSRADRPYCRPYRRRPDVHLTSTRPVVPTVAELLHKLEAVSYIKTDLTAPRVLLRLSPLSLNLPMSSSLFRISKLRTMTRIPVQLSILFLNHPIAPRLFRTTRLTVPGVPVQLSPLSLDRPLVPGLFRTHSRLGTAPKIKVSLYG